MASLSQELAKFVVETGFEDLPEPVVHEAKRILLDSIGCAIAGIATDKGKISIKLARRLGGPPESSIIGLGDKVSCFNAAFANGELINALDYDPLLFPPGHVSPCVIPPSLAIAESNGASGKDMILAIVLGHEISVRISRCLPPQSQPIQEGVEKGSIKWASAYGIINQCIFGGAVGAGKILKLDAQQMTHALGIAGYMCSGPTFLKWADATPSAMTKQGSAGWAAAGGINAALLAEMGYTGDATIFDGEYGFWRFFAAQKWEPDKATEKIGKEWFTLRTRYKLYPCGGVMDGALDCFISLINKNNLMPDDIQSVKAFCQPLTEKLVFRANELVSSTDSQFNLPYLIAVAAHRIKVEDWHDWDTLSNTKILGFMKRVNYQSDPGSSESRRTAAVEVVARGKTFIEEKLPGTDSRATDEQLVEKFKQNVMTTLTQDKATEAIRSVLELEKVPDVAELIRQITM